LKVPEKFRVLPEHDKTFGTPRDSGNYGAFMFGLKGYKVFCLVSSTAEWEHVSVSIDRVRTPTWEVMEAVKALFWDADDTVLQFHVPDREAGDCYKSANILHLWRPRSQLIGQYARPEESEWAHPGIAMVARN